MTAWKKISIPANTSVRDAVKVIDAGALQIALVVDDKDHLVGTLTDGDIRRGILAGFALDVEVNRLMNTKPLTVMFDDDRQEIFSLMKKRRIHQVPIIDHDNKVVGIESIDDFLQPIRRENLVVLMAGGLGSRLRPLTNNCPKPLLTIGNKPILEIIISNFIEQGFYKFYISVNYMAEKIKAHFGDGGRLGVEIKYLEETKPMGTAGALRLLPVKPSEPFFVMNGDILAKVNFSAMLDFHLSNSSLATMGVRQFSHTIPYGVVTLEGDKLKKIDEKPESKIFVSSGIYLLSPLAITEIPNDSFYDMPTLFQTLIDKDCLTSGFPVHEYWIDIGRLEDFNRAQQEFSGI